MHTIDTVHSPIKYALLKVTHITQQIICPSNLQNLDTNEDMHIVRVKHQQTDIAFNYSYNQITVKVMKMNVPPLNVIVATIHLIIIGITLYVLKLANRPINKFTGDSRATHDKQASEKLNYNKLIALSWLKKYTIIGTLFESDKKYLLKQFTFVAAYAVTCLKVNTIILWPLAFSSFLVPCFVLLFDVVLKKAPILQVDESASKNKTANHHGSSEIQIESVNIESRQAFSVDRHRNKQSVKLQSKSERNNFEIILLVSLTVAVAAMLLQTVMVISNSVSNSGQLNILSLLAIISLDQLAIRLTYGIITFASIKLLQTTNVIVLETNLLVSALCQQQITIIAIELQRERQQKAKQITASPPKTKTESPSKVPHAPAIAQKSSSLLNLINFQPTKRRENSQIEQIYFTTQQKEMFQVHPQAELEVEVTENKSGILTKRNPNKQNQTISYSAIGNKHTKATIAIQEQKKGYDDIVILKNDPLEQNGQFYFESPHNTHRKGVSKKKKNKRNLNLTGNSPYLEYLPDMLKKVDKYKNAHRKDQRVL